RRADDTGARGRIAPAAFAGALGDSRGNRAARNSWPAKRVAAGRLKAQFAFQMRLPSCLELAVAGLIGFAAASASAAEKPKGASSKPNIVFILCDDLGYGDVGVFYQNLRKAKGEPCELTPHVDAMAAEGIQLLDHYSGAPVCAPARASLLAGVHQGHAGVRD